MSKFLTSIGESFSLRRLTRLGFLIILILAVVAAWKYFYGRSDQAANYTTASVERGSIQNLVTATGILQPREYVDVGAQVSGQVKKLWVVVGQQVKAGDLLAEIDATVYRAKVDGIRAQLLNQQAQLGVREAQLLLAKIRVERQQNLFKDDATTKESLQTSEASYKSAASLLKALQAQIQQTESSLRAEEANLEYARIYAPMTGTVVSITSRQGQTLNANQQAPTVMRIADLSTMTVQTQVSEADIGKLQVGMPVYFTTLGGQDYRWYSKLDRIEPTPVVTNNVVLYNALFDIPNDGNMLMTQMSTQVFFIASQARDTLVVPASAINFKPRKPGDAEGRKTNGKPNSQKPESEKVTAKADANDSSKDASNQSSSSSQAKPKQVIASGEERKRGPRKTLAPGTEFKPQPATVQVLNAKGNIEERKVVVGISNRVQTQVIEGLQEGEIVVTGMRQLDKARGGQASPMGAGGPPGGGARAMR